MYPGVSKMTTPDEPVVFLVESDSDSDESPGSCENENRPPGTQLCDGCRRSPATALCHNCQRILCGTCQSEHVRESGNKKHLLIELRAVVLCTGHKRTVRTHFCHTCQTTVCAKCLRSADHHDHKWEPISSAIKTTEQQLRDAFGRDKGNEFEDSVVDIESQLVKLSSHIISQETTMKHAVKEVATLITNVNQRLEQITKEFTLKLTSSKNEIETKNRALVERKKTLIKAQKYMSHLSHKDLLDARQCVKDVTAELTVDVSPGVPEIPHSMFTLRNHLQKTIRSLDEPQSGRQSSDRLKRKSGDDMLSDDRGDRGVDHVANDSDRQGIHPKRSRLHSSHSDRRTVSGRNVRRTTEAAPRDASARPKEKRVNYKYSTSNIYRKAYESSPRNKGWDGMPNKTSHLHGETRSKTTDANPAGANHVDKSHRDRPKHDSGRLWEEHASPELAYRDEDWLSSCSDRPETSTRDSSLGNSRPLQAKPYYQQQKTVHSTPSTSKPATSAGSVEGRGRKTGSPLPLARETPSGTEPYARFQERHVQSMCLDEKRRQIVLRMVPNKHPSPVHLYTYEGVYCGALGRKIRQLNHVKNGARATGICTDTRRKFYVAPVIFGRTGESALAKVGCQEETLVRLDTHAQIADIAFCKEEDVYVTVHTVSGTVECISAIDHRVVRRIVVGDCTRPTYCGFGTFNMSTPAVALLSPLKFPSDKSSLEVKSINGSTLYSVEVDNTWRSVAFGAGPFFFTADCMRQQLTVFTKGCNPTSLGRYKSSARSEFCQLHHDVKNNLLVLMFDPQGMASQTRTIQIIQLR